MVTRRIVVIGAGAAGLTAAKRLIEAPKWIPSTACWKPEVTVLEASHRIGGRIGKDTEWTDYPIDVGASWISDRARLHFIAQDPRIISKVIKHLVSIFETENYQGYYVAEDGDISPAGSRNPRRFDMLWANYTWFDFFNDHVASAIPKEQLILNCPVEKITYRKKKGDVAISACEGRTFFADHVILTSSLAVLQQDVIEFQPKLPAWVLEGRRQMWKGFKYFIEFETKIYPDYAYFDLEGGEHDWWDYSKIQGLENSGNIVSGYYMGVANRKFQRMNEEEIIQEVLRDLDKFPGVNGQASKQYVRHKLFHYARDFPYIRGTYSQDCPPYAEDGPQEVIAGRRLLLAGEAFAVPKCQIGWVDGAALSGLHAAEQILSHIDATVDWFSIPQSLKETYR
jgi:monoamine oxidase